MGLLKQSLAVLLVAVAITYLPKLLEPKLPPIVEGWFRPEFAEVAETLKANIENGAEKEGAAFAIYHKGEVLLDMWVGYADRAAHRRWRNETITQTFSCTKGLMAILVALYVDRGLLDYKKPVKDYWPEFAQKDKGNITVEMLTSHQAGLAVLDPPLMVQELKTDRNKVEKVLAEQATIWPAGSGYGYHALTYGLYLDVLLSKVDPKGRRAVQIFDEEISEPFGIDFHLVTPPHEWYRNARQAPMQLSNFLYDLLTNWEILRVMATLILSPGSILGKAFLSLRGLEGEAFNNPEIRELPLVSISGTGTARGLAKFYGILANGGSYQGKQLLSEGMIGTLSTPIFVKQKDLVVGLETTGGHGMFIKDVDEDTRLMGHPGHGGNVGMADMHNNLGIAYVTNYLTVYGTVDDPRYTALEKATYHCLQKYLAQQKKKLGP